MKKTILTLLLAVVCLNVSAMSFSKLRKNARFLSDRMAYELDLTARQYDDVYEINYDFLYAVSPYLEDMVIGYADAVNCYYTYLDYRNQDLSYVLTLTQYYKFMANEYFYRPIYSTGTSWALRIYTIYSNRNFYFFDKPSGYKYYSGANGYNHRPTRDYYANRYTGISHYTGRTAIHGSDLYGQHSRNDFGHNIHDRNQPNYNNYSNGSANNRTQDKRYRDNSGNTNSPQINHRDNNSSQHNYSTNGQRGQANGGQRGQSNSGQKNYSNNNNGHNSQQSNSTRNQNTHTTTTTNSQTSTSAAHGGLRGNTNTTQQQTTNSNTNNTTSTRNGQTETNATSGGRRGTTQTTTTSGRGGR